MWPPVTGEMPEKWMAVLQECGSSILPIPRCTAWESLYWKALQGLWDFASDDQIVPAAPVFMFVWFFRVESVLSGQPHRQATGWHPVLLYEFSSITAQECGKGKASSRSSLVMIRAGNQETAEWWQPGKQNGCGAVQLRSQEELGTQHTPRRASLSFAVRQQLINIV